MDIDFRNLSPKQEQALREILAQCKYLNGAMRYEPSESVLRSVAQQIANDYDRLK